MPPIASEQLLRQRLRVMLAKTLRQFEARPDESQNGTEPHFPLVSEDEARTMFDCLEQLGLSQDAERLVKAWRPLHYWMLGPRLDLAFANIAAERPEERDNLQQMFGQLP